MRKECSEKKIKCVIYGGGVSESRIENYINYEKVCVLAISDRNENLWGKKRNLPSNAILNVNVIAPSEINQLSGKYDIILVVSSFYSEIYSQLRNLGIKGDKIINYKDVPVQYKEIFVDNFYWKQGMPYIIDNLSINLGQTCQLPIYQKKHPMYDRFIKYLGMMEKEIAMHKNESSYIFDIGANVGDTLFGLLNNTFSNIVSVEPSKEYYGLLTDNIKKLDNQLLQRVIPINAFISIDSDDKYVTKLYNGTAVKVSVMRDAEAPTKSIPALMEEIGIKEREVTLIKVDTDGYDFDCVMSCRDFLKRQMPLIYWENYIDTLEQVERFKEMDQYLFNCGYEAFFVFDNLGNYMGEWNIGNLKDINDYLMRINIGYAAKTFYYLDILACKKEYREICLKYIGKYLENYPIQRFID